ncbi:MAG: hypothetical protein WBO08_07660 [Mycobacterium sp.]
MLAAIALIPSAPVLVPELAGGAATELADLRAALGKAVSVLPDRWIAIGVGADDAVIGPQAVGTFAGYGADVRIALSPAATGPVTDLPLCALMAGWVRQPSTTVEVRVHRPDHDVEVTLARGRALRAEIDEAADPVGVLVVADGAHTLTPSAPGGYDAESVTVQQALDDALAAGDGAALTRLPAGVVGRVAYQVLAGLAGDVRAHELYRGAPYGVGYFAGTWLP